MAVTSSCRIEALSELRDELDPLTPRPPGRILTAKADDGIFGLAQFFTRNDVARLKSASDYRFEGLTVALADPASRSLFDSRPFSRLRTMESLLRTLGADEILEACCGMEEQGLVLLAARPDPLQLAEGSDLVPFRDYCFSCHRDSPVPRLDFMSGDSEETVWRNILATRWMDATLDWDGLRGTAEEGDLMPPKRSRQYGALERAVEQGEDPIKAMRDALSQRASR